MMFYSQLENTQWLCSFRRGVGLCLTQCNAHTPDTHNTTQHSPYQQACSTIKLHVAGTVSALLRPSSGATSGVRPVGRQETWRDVIVLSMIDLSENRNSKKYRSDYGS